MVEKYHRKQTLNNVILFISISWSCYYSRGAKKNFCNATVERMRSRKEGYVTFSCVYISYRRIDIYQIFATICRTAKKPVFLLNQTLIGCL